MGSEQKKKKIILTKEERQSIFSDSFVFTRTSTNLYVGASRHTSQEGARCWELVKWFLERLWTA
jgi:hypothetical protein